MCFPGESSIYPVIMETCYIPATVHSPEADSEQETPHDQLSSQVVCWGLESQGTGFTEHSELSTLCKADILRPSGVPLRVHIPS